MSEFKTILHTYDDDGWLHADHGGERGITEADIEQVLTGSAYVERDIDRPRKFYAVGPTSGQHPYLVVPCREVNEETLIALTAWPAEKGSEWHTRYLRSKRKGGLWIPAKSTTGR